MTDPWKTLLSCPSIFASMGNLNVAIIGPVDYAKDLAKKGTSTDITLYDMKKDQDTVTLIEPTKYPERIAPLFYSVSMANVAPSWASAS
jgi:hypothetical protein